MKRLLLIAFISIFVVSCTTVSPGHKGVEVEWGGKTNMNEIYSEGMHTGFHWLFDDIVEYDVREKTMVHKFEFNDHNNMATNVEMSLDYSYNPNKVNLLHSKITDVELKIIKTLKSAGKEVVPQYSAVELNISKRVEAETLLSKIISEELTEFYIQFKRLQLTDVDLPENVARVAEQTATQVERNKLAEKKEAEKVALARAKVAEARGDSAAAIIRALGDAELIRVKERSLKNADNYLRLKELEVQGAWAEKGVSPWGSSNVFGDATVIKGFK